MAINKRTKTNPRFKNGHKRRNARKRLIAASNGICPLCGKPLDVTMPPACHCDPYYPVIDEIIPLAKGGKLTIANQQLVHRICNAKKGTKLMSELYHDHNGEPSKTNTTRDWGLSI